MKITAPTSIYLKETDLLLSPFNNKSFKADDLYLNLE